MNEETEVQTEQPVETAEKAPTGKAAFTAARESLRAQSEDHDAPETQDDTSPDDKQPAEDTEKVTDQPPEVTEDPNALTPEELAALPPKERARAEKWQAKLTQKAQALSAQAKEFEQWKPLIDAFSNDTDATIERVAKERGFKISREAAIQDTVNTQTAETMAALPPELDFLKPVFEQFGKTILASVESKLKPIAQSQNEMLTSAAQAETEATIAAFDAKYPGWKKHETRMLEFAQKFSPTNGNMRDTEYLETLYKLATMDVSKAEQTKKVIEKINKSAASVEPNTSGVPNERVEHALPPPDKRSIRDAFKAASRGERWTK